MKVSDTELEGLVRSRDHRGVARLITLLENEPERARRVIAGLYGDAGRSHVIGITGAPGAGKSTLVDIIAAEFRKREKSVAIVAVDPTSPFSGGAILGDRIRMSRAAEDPGIFIRSMATRGALGGLARATIETVSVLDCAGFDVVLVETVGVGQAEVDIMRLADTCGVVLVPGMGDSVQIVKAGLVEIADVFVINKADYDGAGLLERDLIGLLSLAEYADTDWKPPITKTVATSGEGASNLVDKLVDHGSWLQSTTKGAERRKRGIEHMLIKFASENVVTKIAAGLRSDLERLSLACYERKKTPFEAVAELEKLAFGGGKKRR